MRIRWLGHACFLIESRDGLRVITDPYAVGGGIGYSPINESADVVLVSHDHGDHNNVSAVQGKPDVIRGSGLQTARGVQFRGVATYHDDAEGKKRGTNNVFCFTMDDIRLCHLGDLGHVLTQDQVKEIGAVDVLFIPVGGFYTIDADEAGRVCDLLNPRLVAPMHFKTSGCAFPIAGVDDFLKGKERVRRAGASEKDLEREGLPSDANIVVLEPALAPSGRS